jgi:hypothetical protein
LKGSFDILQRNAYSSRRLISISLTAVGRRLFGLSLAVALLASMLAGPPFASSASADFGCINCVSFGLIPTITQLGDYTAVQVAVSNPLGNSMVGLVHAIVHDSKGHTVANSTGVLDLGPSANGNTTILIFGLTLGTLYSATIFADNASGVAISVPETVNLTPEQGGTTANGSVPLGTATFRVEVTQGCPNTGIPCETYVNASNSTTYGVAYLVLHNSLGETVDISTALVVLSPGQQLTVFLPIVNPNGTATEFATSVDQFAISPLATVSFQT